MGLIFLQIKTCFFINEIIIISFRYIGNLKSNKLNGQGKLIKEDGSKYEGDF